MSAALTPLTPGAWSARVLAPCIQNETLPQPHSTDRPARDRPPAHIPIHSWTPCPAPAAADHHVLQVLTAIQAVGDRLYELAEAGVPMPRELTYYDHIGDTFMPDLMRPPLYRVPGVEYTPPDPQWERVQRLGHGWGALDLRAHVEKRAAKKLRAVVSALVPAPRAGGPKLRLLWWRA